MCLSAKAKPSLQGWRISEDSVGFVTYLRSHRSGYEPLVEPSALEFAHSVLSYQAVTNFPEDLKMALVSMRELLDHAAVNGYGIPAFNVNNLEQVQAVMEAARETGAPVILQASAGARKYAGEAFIKGYWSSPAPVEVMRLFSANLAVLESFEARQSVLVKLALKIAHRLNRNTRKGSQVNIAAHGRSQTVPAHILNIAFYDLTDAGLAKQIDGH